MDSFKTTLARGGLVARSRSVPRVDRGGGDGEPEAGKASSVQAQPLTGPTRARPRASAVTRIRPPPPRRPAFPRIPGGHAHVAEGLPGVPRRHEGGAGVRACHGPGKEHAEASGDKTKILRFASLSPKDASQTCVSCHFRTNHTFWAGSQHDERSVGCTRATASTRPWGRSSSRRRPDALCAQCHRTIVKQAVQVQPHAGARGQALLLLLPQRPRVAEREAAEGGRHGQRIVHLLPRREARPHLWEHPGDRELLLLHDPHGSNNDRMLVAKQPFLSSGAT